MLFSLWLGFMLAAGQTGCTSANSNPALASLSANNVMPARPARIDVPPPAGMGRALRNADSPLVPKVPPPGARTTYSSVHVNGQYLAITFDDGPQPQNTPRLLRILRERNIKATFFVVGQMAKEHPEIIRAILADGHEIGNHTWSHPLNMTRLSDEKNRHEVADASKLLFDIAGYRTRLFRPPGGATNPHLKQMLYTDFGMSTILWSVDPNDWKRPGVSVVTSRLVNGAHPGAILLCHDLHAPTVDAMPGTLDQLLARGYRFVTVSQLLNMESDAPPAVTRKAEPAGLPPAPGAPPADVAPSLAPAVGVPGTP
jgi:peptidoglycan/xylan/chitin deacetylase (PgdA/CDA1 family)